MATINNSFMLVSANANSPSSSNGRGEFMSYAVNGGVSVLVIMALAYFTNVLLKSIADLLKSSKQ